MRGQQTIEINESSEKRRKVTRNCLQAYPLLILLWTLLLSGPGDAVWLYLVFVAIATIQLLFGERKWRSVGLAFFFFGAALAIKDYRDGSNRQQQIDELKHRIESEATQPSTRTVAPGGN